MSDDITFRSVDQLNIQLNIFVDELAARLEDVRATSLNRLDRIAVFHSSDGAPDPKCLACHQAHPCHTWRLARGRE